MNPVDLGVVAVIALSALFAFARGFVREALSIVAWVGAAAITIYGFGFVYAIVTPVVPTPLLADLIAGAGLFIAGLIVLTIATGLVARSVRTGALSPIDRTIGFIFGLLRGAVLVSLAYLLLDATVQFNERPAWLRDAKSMPFLAQGADMLRSVLPESLRAKTAGAADETQRALNRERDAQRAIRALANPVAAANPATASPAANSAANPVADTTAPRSSNTVPLPPNAAAAPIYNNGDRRNLDRLIENQR